MSHKSNACSFIHEWSHGGSFAKKRLWVLFFAFFFFPIQAATWTRVQFVCGGDIPKFIHLFISCYSTSDARQRLVRVELDAIPATDTLTGQGQRTLNC